MNESSINFKDLYNVTLRATFPIEMNGRKIEVGEVVAAFDKIQLANLDEKKSLTSANGGFDNRALVWWEETKEIRLSLIQGVFSKDQLAVMTGAKLLAGNDNAPLLVNSREVGETDENGVLQTKHPIVAPIFVYDKRTGAKLGQYSYENDVLTVGAPYQELLVDYYYNYYGKNQILTIGQSLTNGYLSLTGKMRVKDDVTGLVTTGIITIPKLKLTSSLSMRLGHNSIPVVGRVDAIAVPDGPRGSKKVMELVFLNDDLDSDM